MDLVKRFIGERQKAVCKTTAEWGNYLVGWLVACGRGGGQANEVHVAKLRDLMLIIQNTKLGGAAEARRAHNPEVTRSKRVQAIFFCFFPPLLLLAICLPVPHSSSE